jgi:superfamily II DNA or RNA helicase
MRTKPHKLYAFQTKAVKAAITAVTKNVKLLVVSAVGSGKTLMMAELVKHYSKLGWEVVLVTPRKELVTQALSKLEPKHDVTVLYRGTPGQGGDTRITYGTIQSIIRRHKGSKSRKTLLLIDEAHHTPAMSWTRLNSLFPNASVVGFTATPTRLDGKPLREHFDQMFEAATPLEAVDVGLVRIPRIFVPTDHDLWKHAHAFFRHQKGEVSETVANTQLLKRGLVGDVVAEWFKHALGLRTLVFAASREHGHALVRQFAKKRVSVGYLDGSLPVAVRDKRLEDFRSGKILVMVSVELLIEGFDLPQIDCGILARPTDSLVYHLQMCGRASRNYPGAGPSILLDPVQNTMKVHLGLPEVPRAWSLDGAPKIARDAQVILCPCGRVGPVRTVTCPDCGTKLTGNAASGSSGGTRMPRELEGALSELGHSALERLRIRDRIAKEFQNEDQISWEEAVRSADEFLLRVLARRGLLAHEVQAGGA